MQDDSGGKESGEGMADWVSIKTEYINTQIGFRGLADKYSVSKNTIAKKAKEEGWAEERDRQRDRIGTLVGQKTAEAVSDLQADRIAQLLSAGQKAARLLNSRLDQMADDGKIKTYEVKAITEALKNVRDLYKTEELPTDDDPLIKYMEEMRNA